MGSCSKCNGDRRVMFGQVGMATSKGNVEVERGSYDMH